MVLVRLLAGVLVRTTAGRALGGLLLVGLGVVVFVDGLRLDAETVGRVETVQRGECTVRYTVHGGPVTGSWTTGVGGRRSGCPHEVGEQLRVHYETDDPAHGTASSDAWSEGTLGWLLVLLGVLAVGSAARDVLFSEEQVAAADAFETGSSDSRV